MRKEFFQEYIGQSLERYCLTAGPSCMKNVLRYCVVWWKGW